MYIAPSITLNQASCALSSLAEHSYMLECLGVAADLALVQFEKQGTTLFLRKSSKTSDYAL